MKEETFKNLILSSQGVLDESCSKELDKKLTKSKYKELMKYLNKNSNEIKYRLSFLGTAIYSTRELFICRTNIWSFYNDNAYRSIIFKDKKIKIHPEQFECLYNKAEYFFKDKELSEMKKNLKE